MDREQCVWVSVIDENTGRHLGGWLSDKLDTMDACPGWLVNIKTTRPDGTVVDNHYQVNDVELNAGLGSMNTVDLFVGLVRSDFYY